MQAIIILVSILGYLVILFEYRASTKSGARDIEGALADRTSLRRLKRRTINTTPLMFLSLIYCSAKNQNIFLQFSWNEKFTLIIILVLCLCFGISFYNGLQARNKLTTVVSPQESISYLSVRIPGLIIYEIFFRGVLFGIFLEWFSTSTSVILNVVLYSMAHAFSSRREFFGSIPFGVVLCCVTILSQSIYPAVLLHLTLALPFETILLTKHQLLTKKF
jgi:membrane protease YdiL (CAAX protease family)